MAKTKADKILELQTERDHEFKLIENLRLAAKSFPKLRKLGLKKIAEKLRKIDTIDQKLQDLGVNRK